MVPDHFRVNADWRMVTVVVKYCMFQSLIALVQFKICLLIK